MTTRLPRAPGGRRGPRAAADLRGGARRRSLLLATLTLPGTVLVYVPAFLVWATAGTPYAVSLAGPGDLRLWAAAALAAAGLALSGASVRLFDVRGEGMPAPWNPPTRFVVEGPYRYVRNPMISGVLLLIVAEALMLGSRPIAVWAAVFFVANAAYFPLVEEPGLERRFGDDYRRYKRNVPRWIPRLSPWTSPEGS